MEKTFMKQEWKKLGAALLCAVMTLSPVVASAEMGRGHEMRDERREDRREDRFEDRREHRDWRFERDRGWRYEVRPGYWSPYYVWWWVDGRQVLRPYPARTVLVYGNGQYELRGDGYRVPYYWVWIPAVPVAPPAPPPPPMAPEEYSAIPEPPPAPPMPAPPPVPAPQVKSSGGKDTAGMVIGGVVGGVLGSAVTHGRGRTAGVIVGTLIGALFGHEIGKQMDDADELRAAHALEKNRTNQTSSWVNPDTGNTVAVTPTKTFQDQSGQYCREYQSEVTVGGEKKTAYGTACRQPDGQWKIVK